MSSCIPEFVKLLAPSITTVILGGVVVQRIFVHRANQATFIDHLIGELSDLRNEALDYWSQSTTSENHPQMRQLESRVKGRVHALVMDLNNFRDTQTPAYLRLRRALTERIPFIRMRISQEETPGYITAMIELFEACTGDDFESDSHSANPSKYFTICSRVSTIKSELIKVKL